MVFIIPLFLFASTLVPGAVKWIFEQEDPKTGPRDRLENLSLAEKIHRPQPTATCMASKNAAEAALSSTDLLRKVQEEVLPALEPSIKPTQQGQSTRWNSILVFSDKPVPTTPEAFDELYPPGKEGKERLCASASFTVLECLRAGFEKTPKRTEGAGTKNAKYIEDADAKLLAALQPAPDGSPAKGMQVSFGCFVTLRMHVSSN